MAETNTVYPPPLAIRALDIARSKIGERETGGPNRGPIVEWSLRGIGEMPKQGKGPKWCAFFMWQCFLRASQSPAQEKAVDALASGSTRASWHNVLARKWEKPPEHRPEPGYLVFFAQGDQIYHCGIVEQVAENSLVTIEGNHGDRVGVGTYSLRHPTIFGYAEVLL